MGHQALKAHQGDVRYARQDTQNVFLCRCHVEYRAGYWVENQVMTLHVVGYWRSDERPELPDPHLLVDDTGDEDERSTIAGYLDTGTYLRGFMGLSQCRLC